MDAKDLKWAPSHTGGGCWALEAELPDGRYVLATTHDDGSHLPELLMPALLGLYNEDGEEEAYVMTGPVRSLDDLSEAAKVAGWLG